ncbi:protein of unknown function (DUF1707) [Streptoalloteichus tenebrarius]|uniref:DUF1707 domain-containing protein n=1 Tax=Streptoalloteichus tenebrarius (strain ATCC 17920 / DSM 40477 / JCM 4838 / CBS 697.72 / NBRC 16177 / NCIMB 11028 / NRRL B-12390 / A12253. 1 / ISP 5477) TaxID=1933 RepID=A0ABT1HYS7_STRSD|nr:DUF1707 domain-containing protein [Streptoalloteichus tenebrarius]MCP2260684.1 protein of unknown function (DUF1707) [Streptoalloteichus tenebrarius]BFF03783.1 DUF1707 domain-containing protein [Streptoalloteichus tenebrarius]
MDRVSGTRASVQERERAIEALGEHVRLQRIDLAEFDSRVAMATAARTRAELAALFEDLPAPHPRFDDDGAGAEVAPRAATAPATRSGRSVSGVAKALYPLTGAVALVLVITTGWWWWFLLVPPLSYAVRQLTRGGESDHPAVTSGENGEGPRKREGRS